MIMPRVRKTGFRVFFNAVSALVLFFLFYNSACVHSRNQEGGSQGRFHQTGLIHGRVLQEVHEPAWNATNDGLKVISPQVCAELFEHEHLLSHCDFFIEHPECGSSGFFNYIKFFYCDCKNYRPIGYLVLGAWLAILFYLIGNTAADYFCCSLEKLSELLKMSPTVAGVTLLPLGNGAADVFASIAAFAGSGSDDVGFNGIMGGAIFVTCVVVGTVSFSIADKRVEVDRKCFIRDVSFFLFTVACLTLILVTGKVNIWGAMAFVSIYVVYAIFVAMNEILRKKVSSTKLDGLIPMLPVAESSFSWRGEDGESKYIPLLSSDYHGKPADLLPKPPHWVWSTKEDNNNNTTVQFGSRFHEVWSTNVAIYSDYVKVDMEDGPSPLWGWTDECVMKEKSLLSFSRLCSLLEIPLHVPRRLTIPIIEEDRWSKNYAICSAFLAPLLLAFLWNSRQSFGPLSSKIACFIGFSTSSTLGLLAFFHTSNEHPPRRCLFPWVFGGFFMSITWFYIIVKELVFLLVSFGVIFGINPSMLALTVLAWGNSMSDLMSNTALAMNEKNGVQMAMSGCYGGPMFNTLVGLGASLLLKAWSMGSVPCSISTDSSLLVTLGFLAAGLIWALIVLPLSNMRPNKILAVGLITIYLMFLSVRVGTAMGSGSPDGPGIKMI